jgi:hypothetical protein
MLFHAHEARDGTFPLRVQMATRQLTPDAYRIFRSSRMASLSQRRVVATSAV